MSSSVQIVQLGLISLAGFVFWLVAVRRFSPDTVGETSALVTLMTLVTYMTSLGLPVTVARFANSHTTSAARVMRWSVFATTAGSAVGTVVVAVVASDDLVGPLLDHGPLLGWTLFFLAVNGLSLFTLLDYRQLALGDRRSVLIRTVIVTVLRLTIIVAPIADEPFWLWLWMALSTPIALVLAAPWQRREPVVPDVAPPPAPSLLVRFSGVNFVSLLLAQAPLVVFPVIVVSIVPPSEAATFFVVWSIAASTYFIPAITGRALLVEGHDEDRELRGQAWFTVLATTLLSAAIVAASVVVALLIPTIYGEEYRDSGPILVVLMLGLLPFSVTATSLTFSRIRMRSAANVATSAVLAVGTLLPTAYVTTRSGALGAAGVWVAGNAAAAVVALWGIAAEPTTTQQRHERPRRLRVAVGVAGSLALGYLMGGPLGVAVALAVAGARLAGIPRLAAGLGVLLLIGAAIATLAEAPLQASLAFAQQRPIAAAMATYAAIIMGATSLMALAQRRPPPPVERVAFRGPSWFVRAGRLTPWLGVAVAAASAAAVIGRDHLTQIFDTITSQSTHISFTALVEAAPDEILSAPLGVLALTYGPVPAAVLRCLLAGIAAVSVVHLSHGFGRWRWVVGPASCFAVIAAADTTAMLTALVLLLATVRLVRSPLWGLAGVAAGFAVLARPEAMFVLLVWIVLSRVDRDDRVAGLSRLVALLLGMYAVITPWLVWLNSQGALDAPFDDLSVLYAFALVPPLAATIVPRPIAVRPLRARPPTATRLRSLLVPGVVAAAAFAVPLLNQPMRYVSEFRFEAAWAPEAGLQRMASMWHEIGGLGRVAGTDHHPVALAIYGALRGVGLSPALAQHLWHGLVLAVAGLGAVVVTRYFRRPVGLPHLIAGLAYMFSPLGLSLFTTSPLYLASIAIAPWLQAAVLYGLDAPRSWRWPAVFALALALALPAELPAVLYNLVFLIPTALVVVLVTRRATWSALAGFVARSGVLAGSVVAFIAVRTYYGGSDLLSRVLLSEPPELASSVSSYSESIRGLGSWLTYFRYGVLTSRPHHAALVESPLVVVATFLVPIAAFLFLLAKPRHVAGAHLALLAALSLMVMVGLYPPDDPTPWGSAVAWMYEHVPSTKALRNTLKAGAPLLLGTSVLLGLGVGALRRRLRGRAFLSWMPPVAASAVIVLASLPAWQGSLYNPGSQLAGIPGYWQDAVAWLDDAEQPTGRVLVLPGSYATSYRWGNVGDDIFGALLDRPYLLSTPYPHSTVEGQNLITTIDDATGAGRADSAGLAEVLRRIGVRYVLLRNDLDWQSMSRPRPFVYDRLREGPGLRLAATFGDPGQNTTTEADTSIAADAERQLPPIEIYEVEDAMAPVHAVPSDGPLLVAGDGEGWWSLADAGYLSTGRPVRYVADMSDDELVDALEEGAPLAVTDTNVRRTRVGTRGGVVGSAALAPDTTEGGAGALFDDVDEQTTSYTEVGARFSGSAAPQSQPWYRPALAFDGDERTEWRTTELSDPRGSWLRVDFAEPTELSRVELTALASRGRSVRGGRIATSDGQSEPYIVLGGAGAVELDGSAVDWVRVEISQLAGEGGNSVGFSEIGLDDLDLVELRQVPDIVAARPRAADDLRDALHDTTVSYFFEREVGRGPAPVEAALRRRFAVTETQELEVRGSLAYDPWDDGLDRPLTGTCGAAAVVVDGWPVPVELDRVDAEARRYEFEGCETVTLEPGWHTVTHDEDIALDRVVLEPDDMSFDSVGAAAASLEEATVAGTNRRYGVTADEAGAFLISGTSYHPGWIASEDGRSLEVISLDTQAAVVVEGTGDHVVEMRFGPQRAYGLAFLAMIAGVALCIWLVCHRDRERPVVHRSTSAPRHLRS